jgi:outer membrane immunogenic protein
MRKVFFVTAAALAVTMTGPAFAADLPLKGAAPFAERFSWTGCYLGGHVGGGLAHKDITDPVQLMQGVPSTAGTTTVSPAPKGVVVGGQIGCDYQFASSLVVGIEGSAAGSTMKGSMPVGLPLSPPDTGLVQAKTDFLTSVTARVGLAFDNVLLYGKGGVAMAGDRYDVSGTSALNAGVNPFDFVGLENRIGWTAGGGLEWAFSQHWSTNIEYDYYGFGHRTPAMFDAINGYLGSVDVRQSIQVVKVGLNFHMWGSGF